MDKKHLKKLIIKYQKGTADQAERFVVERWFDSLDYDENEHNVHLNEENQTNLKKKILLMTKEKKTSRISALFSNYRIAAACLLLVLTCSFLLYHYTNRNLLSTSQANNIIYLEQGEIYTEAGEQKEILLLDGSKVILNANSRLSVSDFSESREVVLTGEAFFDVKKYKNKPFTVRGGGLHIKVLGTSFNVNAYPDIENTSVSVHTGKVQISDNKKILSTLKPNDQIKYNKESTDYQLTKSLQNQKESWLSGTVELDQANFEELNQTFYNFYGMTLSTEDEAVKKDLYNLTFRKAVSLEEALQQIQYLTRKKSLIKKGEGKHKIILY